MRRADIVGHGLVALVIAMAAGCGSSRRGELVDRPVTPDTAHEQRGARLFFQHCHRCHPGGEVGLGPSLNDKPLPALAIRTQIRSGVGAMPAFSDRELADGEVDAIAEYVLELRKSPVRGDGEE